MSSPLDSITDAIGDALGDEVDPADVDDIAPHASTRIAAETSHRTPATTGGNAGADEFTLQLEVLLDGEAVAEHFHADAVAAEHDLEISIDTSGRRINDDGREFTKEHDDDASEGETRVAFDGDPATQEAVLAASEHTITAKSTSHLECHVRLSGEITVYDGSVDDDRRIGTLPVSGKWDVDMARVGEQLRGVDAGN